MNIIKKCLDELAKDEFRKDYVIGLLESYYEMESGRQPVVPFPHSTATPRSIDMTPTVTFIDPQKNEEIIPDFLKAGPVVDLRSS